jgi:hypothetical protein
MKQSGARTAIVVLLPVLALVVSLSCGQEKVTVANPSDTPTPDERLIRGDCMHKAGEEAGRIYGQDASLNPDTERFNKFSLDVILVGVVYGKDETDYPTGSDFEELYQALLGESAYVSQRRKEAWDYRYSLFNQCLEAHGVSSQPEPEMDATTRCIAEGVARDWKQYGDDALDYTDEVNFIFDQHGELSVGEAWSIADDYWHQLGKSPFKNPAAFELATSGGCAPKVTPTAW